LTENVEERLVGLQREAPRRKQRGKVIIAHHCNPRSNE